MSLATLTACVQARVPVAAASCPLDALFDDADFLLPQPAQQVSLSLHRLQACLADQDLGVLPGVPPRAVRRRQLAFVAGRLCAERALMQAGAALQSPLLRGEHGQALWPSGWRGSISHTDDQAFAAVMSQAHAAGLGIDAQARIAPDALPAVLTQCMGVAERQLIDTQSDAPWAATVLFAAKEAGFKAIYERVRRFVDFTEYRMSRLDLTDGRFDLVPVQSTAATLPELTGRFRAQGDVVLASVTLPPA